MRSLIPLDFQEWVLVSGVLSIFILGFLVGFDMIILGIVSSLFGRSTCTDTYVFAVSWSWSMVQCVDEDWRLVRCICSFDVHVSLIGGWLFMRECLIAALYILSGSLSAPMNFGLTPWIWFVVGNSLFFNILWDWVYILIDLVKLLGHIHS